MTNPWRLVLGKLVRKLAMDIESGLDNLEGGHPTVV